MALVHAVALLAFTASMVFACDKYPNGTETNFVWWPCYDSPIKFYNATLQDQTGASEYPVHLSKPLLVVGLVDIPKQYGSNLRDDIKIWEWNNCKWSEIPTLGLLSNQDACKNGISCPVPQGNQEWLVVTIDFTPYQAIINLLTNDASYQLEYTLTDRDTNDKTCITAQARAFTKN